MVVIYLELFLYTIVAKVFENCPDRRGVLLPNQQLTAKRLPERYLL